MSGPIQLGDIINFGKIAWDVYQFGWQEEFNATKQYSEFGRDVRGLAENLDILSRVVFQANQSLREQGAYTTQLRWDPRSLVEIIGDYEKTLDECYVLLETNKRYRLGSGPVRNVEWNVLVQPTATRLRARLELHNSKVLHVLKPFEIDLLSRIRQDIYRVHQDLAQRISAVHMDLRRLMGVLVPDLEQALAQQAHRHVTMLDVPDHVADGFRREALRERPEFADDNSLDLQEMTNAFIIHLNQSTVSFTSGMLVENKVPPLDQYLSLLKCVWLMDRIRNCQQLRDPSPESHWPSYVRQLEDDLSAQCERFKEELVAPQLATLRQDMLAIWPEKEPTSLIPIVTKNELMEDVLEVPLSGAEANVRRKLQLLRRMGAGGKRFRINISGTEQTATGKTRKQAETIDFDLNSVILNPLYAAPASMGISLDVILRKDERIAKMAFSELKDVLKFQQAVTGFKAWASYSQFNVMVSFVISGRKEPLVERACLQLWIPKQLEGKLVTNADASTQPAPTARSPSLASTAFGRMPTLATSRDSYIASPDPFQRSPPDRSPIRPSSQFSPPSARSSLFMPQQSQPQRPSISVPHGQPMNIPRRPVGISSVSGSPPARLPSMSISPTSPRSSNLFQPSQSLYGRSPSGHSNSPTLNSTDPTVTGRVDRTFSVSSHTSTTAISNTSSSGSDPHTVAVSLGADSIGYVHRRPVKPLLVLFTQNPADGRLSLVTLQMDDETTINPERCNCRHSGREGSKCAIASIEQKKGVTRLEARRFESRDGDTDWNLAMLAMGRREERGYAEALWKGVQRVSVMFPDAGARQKFGGTPNECHCKVKTEGELSKCLKAGHRGLFGEVQEFYRRQGNEHQVRFETWKEVVNGVRDDSR